MLHTMTTRLIHVHKLDTFHLCCGSGVNQLSLRVIGVKSLFWCHFYSTLSWPWAVAGWETTLSRARLVPGWETKLTGASHWIICSYANPQCQIGCLFLFLELYNLRFTYRLTYLAPLARAQFLVVFLLLHDFSQFVSSSTSVIGFQLNLVRIFSWWVATKVINGLTPNVM